MDSSSASISHHSRPFLIRRSEYYLYSTHRVVGYNVRRTCVWPLRLVPQASCKWYNAEHDVYIVLPKRCDIRLFSFYMQQIWLFVGTVHTNKQKFGWDNRPYKQPKKFRNLPLDFNTARQSSTAIIDDNTLKSSQTYRHHCTEMKQRNHVHSLINSIETDVFQINDAMNLDYNSRYYAYTARMYKNYTSTYMDNANH